MSLDASGRPDPETTAIGDADAALIAGRPAGAATPDAGTPGEPTAPPTAPPDPAGAFPPSDPAGAVAPPAPMSRVGIFALVAAAVVGLDHLTKWIVIENLPFHRDVPIFGEWVMLTHIKNTGGAFGLFPGSTLPLILVSSIASVVLCVLAVRLRHDWTRLMALALILGGAVGNLIDRIVAGKVTDFIHVGIPNGPRWPIFNVADSAVSIGVVILGFLVYFRRHEDEAAAPDAVPANADPSAPSPAPPPAGAPDAAPDRRG